MTVVKPTFICITESWFTPDIHDDLVKIQGYLAFRNDRQDNIFDTRRGGGVVIYASLSSSASEVNLPLNVSKPQGIECNFIKFNDFEVKHTYLLCAYLPPGLNSDTFASFKQYIVVCFDFILDVTPEATLFLCGDFNRYDLSFLSTQFKLSNIVDVPTFGDAILDKFICHADSVNNFHVTTAPGLGPAVHCHNIVLISRNVTFVKETVHFQKVYDLRNSYVSSFLSKISSIDWSPLFSSDDIQRCILYFYEMFHRALSVIPVSHVKITPKTKPWLTPVVIDLINKRWSAFKQKNFPLFHHYKKKVKCEIQKSKFLWSQKMCKNAKGIWTVVNDVRGNTDTNSVSQIVALYGDCENALKCINSLFSEFFDESDNFPVLPVSNRDCNICDVASVYNLLNSLKTSKACGSDEIPPFFLKVSSEVIARPLCHIFNLSFAKGIVPDQWKVADVCPIPKTKPVKKNQLRPISLLPIMSKILEKVILNKYRNHLLSCFDDCQFAYRPYSSTVCALLTIQDTVLKLLDDVSVGAVRIITFDMTRAFDSVPHHLLLSCLSNLNLPDVNSFVNWTNSYLSNRQQRVKLGEAKSSFVLVTSGVPQGSVLGPVLFALYMSSYKSHDPVIKIVKYADDVTIILPVFKSNFDDVTLVNNEVKNFEVWCRNQQMYINASKTKVLNVNFSRTPLLPISNFDNVCIMKILGVLFNDKFSWSDHFDFIGKKVSQRLYVLRILKNVFSHDQLVVVFNAIIQSLMDYASPVFLNPGHGLEAKFRSLCKRAFRIIHGADVSDCESCDILSFEARRKMLSLKLFREILVSPNHILKNLIPQRSFRSQRLILPFVRTSRRADGFFFSCSRFYNESA